MKRNITIYFFQMLALIGLLALVSVPKVFAVQIGDLGAYPTRYDESNPKTKSWFIYDLKPGQTKLDSITVVNNTDRTLDVKIYPVDATTTSDGAFALLNSDQKQKEVGSWVTLSKDLITVGPRDRQAVPFTITIPKDTTVGDHPGGIIVQEAKKPTVATAGMGINIVSRVGTRIYETVPGNQIVSLDVRDLAYTIKDNHLVFTFVMQNKGNIILTPTGNFAIKDASGKVFESIPLGNLGAVFPGKPTTITVTSKKEAPSFGQYTATVTVNYSSLKAITKSLTFFLYFRDWALAVPVLLLLLLIIIIVIIKKYVIRKHRFQQTMQPASLTTSQPAVTVTRVSGENVDQVFIARHVKLLGIFVLLIILILSSLFAFILKDFVLNPSAPHAIQVSNQPVVPSIAQQNQQTTLPAPTSMSVDKTAMNIVVLNGSDTPAAASKLGKKLSQDGFTITKTANADTLSSQTTIQYPQGKSEEAGELKDAIKNYYTATTEEASQSAVFTIIIGK